jgi:hypothetical protein
MPLALQSIAEALYGRVATDAAGASVRALLGVDGAAGGAASVIPAHRLDAAHLPAFPFVAWREGVVSGERYAQRAVTGVWWAYDTPGRGYARINAIITAIEAAYPPLAISDGRVLVGPIGQATDDRSLGGLLTRPIQVRYTRRA